VGATDLSVCTMPIIPQSPILRASRFERQFNAGGVTRRFLGRSHVTFVSKVPSPSYARCYFIVAGILLFGIHIFLFLAVENQITVTQQQQTHLVNSSRTNRPYPNANAGVQFFFNNVPVKRIVDGKTPKATTADCISPSIELDGGLMNRTTDGWMYRTCEYTNICWNDSSRQYVAIVDDHHSSNSIPYVSIGGINPRWRSILGSDPELGEIVKMRWKPEEVAASSIDPKSIVYYEMDENTILLPFHSMAGHNVGHLLWDDFYPIYTALRMRGLIPPSTSLTENSSSKRGPKLLLLRHVLENTTLYANCDIRRNKRKQCKSNFERFVPLMGVDPNTFYTTKTSQLTMSTLGGDATKSKPITGKSVALICAKTTVAGIGFLTDHGWHDHGWETRAKTETHEPTHNAGRGRLFYDFAQYLMKHNPTALTSTLDRSEMLPQITFSLESSRDWKRRLNFAHQIEALTTPSLKNRETLEEYTVKSYHMHDLSLSEQMAVATETSIFVTACGGGSMTATFLPRHTVLIVYYDAEGGLDFDNYHVKANHQPARLDWDLLNNAAHLRVHWLPIREMDSPDHINVFSALIRHEIATIKRARMKE
jgi:hypothetical protein